eukprot:6182722-Pleurochrysis_carterae.AAC.2
MTPLLKRMTSGTDVMLKRFVSQGCGARVCARGEETSGLNMANVPGCKPIAMQRELSHRMRWEGVDGEAKEWEARASR